MYDNPKLFIELNVTASPTYCICKLIIITALQIYHIICGNVDKHKNYLLVSTSNEWNYLLRKTGNEWNYLEKFQGKNTQTRIT